MDAADPKSTADTAIAVAQAFQDRGIPAWLIYHDANGWHLAGPKVPGSALAEGLRSVAEQCEEQLPSGPLN
jgi:hypothetical protein